MVVVAGSKLIDELRKVPEDVLSFNDAVDEVMSQSHSGNWILNLYRISTFRIPSAQESAKIHTISLLFNLSFQVI